MSEHNDLTYRRARINGVSVLLPNVSMDNRPSSQQKPLKRWARRRWNWLSRTGQIGLYHLKGNLFSHLEEIDDAAETLEENLRAAMIKDRPLPDRQTHPMEWTREMNSLQDRIDEIVRAQLIEV